VGADGFVGRHLGAHLRDVGDEVIEIIGPHLAPRDDATPLDVRNAQAVARAVRSARPEAVYHLAAVAFGPDASADVRTAMSIAVDGTINVLEAASELDTPPVVLVTGSGEIYGAPEVERIGEETPARPVSLYGATKLAQEALALAWARARGTPVVVTRSFNHIGPGQRETFAIPSFARQLAEIASGRREPRLAVGNLSPVRDFTDVRDVVAAYRLLVAGGHTGEPINVASGRGVAIGEVLETLIAVSGLAVSVERDPARARRHDPPRLVGDPSRLQALTGWAPRVSLAETLADVWEDAKARFGQPVSAT
jgi:GDP-4-dehydro-6-deoxy-D-mannose reductase